MRSDGRGLLLLAIGALAAIGSGCSDEGGGQQGTQPTNGVVPPTPTAPSSPNATPSVPGAAGSSIATAGSAAPPSMAGSGALPPAAGSTAMPPDPMAMAGSGSMPPAGMPPGPLGPEDGDPNAPIISIPEVACGGPMRAFGLGSANFMFDGRDMIVTYPCDKHAGAPATFFLNLHGTTPVEQHFYQHGYFSAHTFAASHNLIIVTPSSVVTQWGNGDDGRDEPHLMMIIDWVYANLNGPEKFDIRGMWVGGHSWGGAYTARFGCKPELADKVKGLVLMSGGGVSGFGGAACANAVSVLISTAEGDGRMPSDQATVATGHGCDAAQNEMILMNNHTFWANCDPGFVHANYYMLGKEHATFMDTEVVESIVDWIKLGRQ